MAYQVVAAVLDPDRCTVTTPAKLAVMVVFAECADAAGQNAYVGPTKGAKRSRTSIDYFKKLTRELRADGHLIPGGISPLGTRIYSIACMAVPGSQGHMVPRGLLTPGDESHPGTIDPRDHSPDPRGPQNPRPGDPTTPKPPRTVIEPPTQSDEASDDVRSVFDAWAASRTAAAGRQSTVKLDSKRRRLIRAAIKSHGLDDVVAAVQGWQQSPHHRGENAARTVYNDLGLLLRDADHIERFRDLHLAANGASVHQITETAEQRRKRLIDYANRRNAELGLDRSAGLN